MQIKISRRNLLKLGLCSAVGMNLAPLSMLSGCATTEIEDFKSDKFSMSKFDKWFKYNKLFNGINPNLSAPHGAGYYPTFRASLSHNVTPGIDFRVPSGGKMVASAPGRVIDIKNLQTGRMGGLMVTVGHPLKGCSEGVKGYPLHTKYAHLNKVYVEFGDIVQRGNPIGNLTGYNNHAKLMLMERDGRRYVDPDFYGENQSYMDYSQGPLIEDTEYEDNPNALYGKMVRQDSIINYLVRHVNVSIDIDEKKYNSKYHWPIIVKFRCLDELYKAAPQLFDIDQAKFEEIRKEFYDSQPITLSLPLE